ncbi:hypothetical protein JW721_03775 [Candidatus Micrarchaeota archaeon]|nr:hypothetical protein [Candidatus Micrarchaeota archaeon]
MARVSKLESKGEAPQVSQGKRAPFKLASRLLEKLTKRSVEKGTSLREEARLPSGPTERRKFLKILGGAAGAAVLLGPSVLKANEKAAKASSNQAEVDSVIDIRDIMPYIDNAKKYEVPLSSGQKVNAFQTLYKTKEHQFIVTRGETRGIDIKVIKGDGVVGGAAFLGDHLDELNILAIDLGKDNPVVQGELLVFATPQSVGLVYCKKQDNTYLSGAVNLYGKGLSRGSAKLGVDFDEETIAIMVVPDKGDRIAQVQLPFVDGGEYKVGNFYTAIFGLTRPPTSLASL